MGTAANSQWVRDYSAALAPYSEEGGYIYFMSDDDQDRTPNNYGATYQRLRTVKAAYDPENQFQLNQNIPAANIFFSSTEGRLGSTSDSRDLPLPRLL